MSFAEGIRRADRALADFGRARSDAVLWTDAGRLAFERRAAGIGKVGTTLATALRRAEEQTSAIQKLIG